MSDEGGSRDSYRWRPWPRRLPSRRRKASTRGSRQKTFLHLSRARRRPQRLELFSTWKNIVRSQAPNRRAFRNGFVKGAEQVGVAVTARRTGVAEENGETEKVTWPKASREHPSVCEQVWTRGCPSRASTKHPKRFSLPRWRTSGERPRLNKGQFSQQLCVGSFCVAGGG